jgi:putative drug exporter of the RND superfamily
VRLVLVPAVMELLGRANWWLPGWLGTALARALPGLATEPGGAPQAVAGTRAGDPARVR